MADYTNRQLSKIIAETSENIESSVLKGQKVSNKIDESLSKLDSSVSRMLDTLGKTSFHIDKKVSELKSTVIRPDLSDLNNFYEEKTAKNIKALNSRLKVPRIGFYVWTSSFFLFSLGILALFLAYERSFKTRDMIIAQYRNELAQTHVVISKSDNEFFDYLIEWLKSDPNARSSYEKWRKTKSK